MSAQLRPILAILTAFTVWGLSPVYYKQLSDVSALEVLCHRTLWSLVFFVMWLALQGRLGDIRAGLRKAPLWPVLVASVLVSTNWFAYIYAVQVGKALESSLGYYIFPLVAVAIGYVFFKERFGIAQKIAIALASVAVLILSVGLGVAPWIALLLATTMAAYGAIKKLSGLGPIVSVVLEVLFLLPLALIWLYGAHRLGWQGFRPVESGAFGRDVWTTFLLVMAGPLTGGPLILFAYAAPKLRLSTLGLLQYVNPSLQFSMAVFVLGEAFTLWHGLAFPIIWIALAIYSFAAWREDQAIRSMTA